MDAVQESGPDSASLNCLERALLVDGNSREMKKVEGWETKLAHLVLHIHAMHCPPHPLFKSTSRRDNRAHLKPNTAQVSIRCWQAELFW